MNEKEARKIISRVGTDDPPLEKLNKLSDMGSIFPYAKGYLEAVEKAKSMEEVLQRISKMAADFGYRSPEQQNWQVTSLIASYGAWAIASCGAWADDALAKWER